MKAVFGEETIERTGPVWGLDHEGELRGCYRPSGHPGVWFRFYLSSSLDANFTTFSSGMEWGTFIIPGFLQNNWFVDIPCFSCLLIRSLGVGNQGN